VAWATPIVEVQQLHGETQAVPAHDDVAIVQIAVILARVVNLLDPDADRMNQVQGLEGMKPASWLTSNEILQKLPLDKVAKQRGDLVASKGKLFRVMVLNDDWTIAEPIELLCICTQRPTFTFRCGKKILAARGMSVLHSVTE
jgi:hypothetical protein